VAEPFEYFFFYLDGYDGYSSKAALLIIDFNFYLPGILNIT
jgi:hypothetical protein